MTKITIYLVAVTLAVVFEVGLSGTIGHSKNWNQFSGHQIGFATGKCSAVNVLLPKPESGCCGRQARADEDNGGDEENGIGDGNTAGADEDNEDDENDDNDDGSNAGSNEDNQDDGNNNNDYGNNEISDSVEDTSGRGNDSDLEEGNGNNDYWKDGIDDIIDGVGNIIDGIGSIADLFKFADEYNAGPTAFNAKSIVEQNASDIAPDGYITAGKAAGLRQYPWLVHLNIKIRQFFFTTIIGCGGSLISPRFVLTAAHCVHENYNSYDDVSIFLAEYNTNTYPTDCVQNNCIKNEVMHPDKIIKHEGFNYYSLIDDIALIRLRGSAPYTEYIRPICLPSFNIDNPKNEGAPLSIAGWGSTGRKASPIKLTAEVKLITHRPCKRYYWDLTTSQICAASENGQDTCQGDSGGPIMAEYEGSFYIVGIVSGKAASASCGSSVPTLYTNVFSYRKWILENMKL